MGNINLIIIGMYMHNVALSLITAWGAVKLYEMNESWNCLWMLLILLFMKTSLSTTSENKSDG